MIAFLIIGIVIVLWVQQWLLDNVTDFVDANFWPEENVRLNDRFLWALEDAAQNLCRFHGLSRVVWAQDWLAQ